MIFDLITQKGREQAKAYIDALPFPKEGSLTKYVAEIKRKSPRRTVKQNRLYWLWLACISEGTGYDKDDLHEIFKRRYLGQETIEVFGDSLEKGASTKELNTMQMRNYLDKVKEFALIELDILLPEPTDHFWPAFEEQYKDYM